MVYVVTRFDLRMPGADRITRRDTYRAAVEIAAWCGDRVGDDPADGSPRGRLTPRPYSDPHPMIFLGDLSGVRDTS